jgi:heme/copper-type cytochrome/quinol oxidase subunit 2
MAEQPQSRALAHTETTDPRLAEMRQAEHDLVRWIVIGIVIAVPVCVVLFMAAIAFAVRNESTDLAAPLAMAAAVGTLAGLFFGAWAGFVFKGNALDEVDRKALLRRERPSPPQARDD